MTLPYILIYLIRVLFEAYVWLIIIRVFTSLIRSDKLQSVTTIIYELTEPLMALCRRFLPGKNMTLDFSPFLAVLILEIAESLLIKLVQNIF